MNMKNTVITIFVLGAFVNVQFAAAGSIYAKKDKSTRSLIVDDTAKEVGDILTVLISEVSEIENKTDRKLEKSTSRSAAFDGKLGIDHSLIPLNLDLPSFNVAKGTASSNKLDGKAEAKDEREITDKVSVIVEDVHPNGNLVVIGKIQRTYAGDKQIIYLSGIVRPSDIKYDNTIKSGQVANLHLDIATKGPTKDYTKVGWLGQILDFIWPF